MKFSENMNPLEHWVTDYVNGHLSDADRARFEDELNKDASLKELVSFEFRIRNTVRASANVELAEVELPQFSSFAARLDAPKASATPSLAQQITKWFDGMADAFSPNWSQWAAPMAAAFVVAVGLGIYQTIPSDSATADDSYITLTDASAEQPPLRLFIAEDLSEDALAELLKEYDLTQIKQYPKLHAIDVALPDSKDLDQVAQELAEDPRLNAVKKAEQ